MADARRLLQFFSYFGSKVMLSKNYPSPTYDTIIEPFAGSAGYACRYYDRDILLIDADPVIVSVWLYLIRATPRDIRSLPLDPSDIAHLSDAERAFIGFWWRRCGATPSLKPVPWALSGRYATSFWGERVRRRIADQVHLIKHWRAQRGDYASAPDIAATWFIDPPYEAQGHRYQYSSIDYAALSRFCRSRRGQIIACEALGATWLPFEPLYDNRTVKYTAAARTIREVVYVSESTLTSPE